jgi:F0F1-type ATP synthase delta subunit
MKQQYVQAVLASVREGLAVDAVLAGLRTTLAQRRHEKLLVPVLLEVLRMLEAEKGVDVAEVRVARAADLAILKSTIATTLADLGASPKTTVTEVIDDTIIGGFVATYNYQEKDQSYKTTLKSLYESITK